MRDDYDHPSDWQVPMKRKAWNSGTSKGWIDKRGYRWLYVDDQGKRRSRREHRVIMERHIGRKLEPWELVHHKDGNTQNNSIENLELMEWGIHTTTHSNGSRRDAQTKRSMEALALMREELKHCRSVQSDLLEALKLAVDNLDEAPMEIMETCLAAIAKAEHGT